MHQEIHTLCWHKKCNNLSQTWPKENVSQNMHNIKSWQTRQKNRWIPEYCKKLILLPPHPPTKLQIMHCLLIGIRWRCMTQLNTFPLSVLHLPYPPTPSREECVCRRGGGGGGYGTGCLNKSPSALFLPRPCNKKMSREP